ncbi:DUF4114 domain-containing protein [Ochrovirga pacifica]|uniref:DUF4114 domain-containing protein n=1 Tax=Ochrovirga pacifica TaxID=1042376 RepID=UPI0002557FA3|nr:DUF4114 domain-containing protein [Ochrovirga pacifica]
MKHVLLLILFFTASLQAQNFNYLGTYTSDGTPEYLENPSDVVTEETLREIKSALPESYPVPDYNPHYISSGFDTDIHINQKAEVYVTFVSEGAWYRNVLGFYTYNTNDPNPKRPNAEDITVIFPNASALNQRGSLLAGDKVKIGEFEAGTSIGWVLLANAWNGSKVTWGLWQLYSNTDYNPENDETLRKHNVLLADDKNQRVILGFEDVRRDYASCDHDFNDAIFYVTATPYSAIVNENITKVESATDVTSANNGGLESNGTLAEKIAKRNFKRSLKHTQADTKSRQTRVRTLKTLGTSTVEETSLLQNYIPETGMFGNESSYVSSPTDLVEITNAEEVFSIDYYTDDHRIAAALASYTSEHVYDHTKAICDRLNNSSLEDVRLVTVRGHQMIYSKILRESGELENTLSFSIKKEGNQYELYSFWNIDQYPEGDYYNFQVWGGSNGQVFAIANQIIDKFSSEALVTSDHNTEKIPDVFVKSGYYQNGKVHLELINNTRTTAIALHANYKSTEHADTASLQRNISLSGNRQESIVVETGNLFDAGISIQGIASTQMDALYLADGPWGIDYLEEGARVSVFDITQNNTQVQEGTYAVERNLLATGSIKNTFNAFRQVLPGDQALDIQNYNAIQFKNKSTHPVELVLMQSGLEDWEDRYSYVLEASNKEVLKTIAISDFTDKYGNKATIKDVKRIVFSINGNGNSFENFELAIQNVTFTNVSMMPNDDEVIQEETTDIGSEVYPNPFTDQTRIKVTNGMVNPIIRVYNILGKLVETQQVSVNQSNQTITYKTKLSNGIYVYTIEEEGIGSKSGKFIVN